MLPAREGFVENGFTDDKFPREKAAVSSLVEMVKLPFMVQLILLLLAILIKGDMDDDVEGDAVVDVEVDWGS